MAYYRGRHDMKHAALIHFPQHIDTNDILCVFESSRHVPFDIKRVFTVSVRGGGIRGDHAHKKCAQLLICVYGQILVTCDDGYVVKQYLLDSTGIGLLIPSGIWAKEDYMVDDAVLMVLCDRAYEADDYIRDYNDFKSFLESKESR